MTSCVHNTAVLDQYWNQELYAYSEDPALNMDMCFGDELDLTDATTTSLTSISMLSDSNFESSASGDMVSPMKQGINVCHPDYVSSQALAAPDCYDHYGIMHPSSRQEKVTSHQPSSSLLCQSNVQEVFIDDGYSSWSECTPSIKDIIDPELYRHLLDTIMIQDTDLCHTNTQSSTSGSQLNDASSGSRNIHQVSSPSTSTWSPEQTPNSSPVSMSPSTPPMSVQSVDSDDAMLSSNEAPAKKPTESYLAIIAKVMISNNSTQMLLCDIYKAVMERYPFFQNNNSSWRSSIRHNLSANDCFVRMPTRTGAKACWGIRPEYITPFRLGDFGTKKTIRKLKAQQMASNNAQQMYCDASHYAMAQNSAMMHQQYNHYNHNYRASLGQYTTDQYGQQVYVVV